MLADSSDSIIVLRYHRCDPPIDCSQVFSREEILKTAATAESSAGGQAEGGRGRGRGKIKLKPKAKTGPSSATDGGDVG